MTRTYTSKYLNGAAVDAALDQAQTAVQPGDLGSAASCDIGTGSGDVAAGDHGHATAAPSGEGVPGSDGFLSAADKAKIDGLGTAAAANVGDFATAAQGSKADTAVQPTDVLPVFIKVKNVTDGSLAAGTPIYPNGAVGAGDVAEVIMARADTANARPAAAILNTTLAKNATGTATVIGQMTGIDTSGLNLGNVYLAPTGGLTNTPPWRAAHIVQWLGTVERKNATTGIVYANVTGPIAPVVDALNSTSTTAPLSAAQGKALADGKITGPASATDNAVARFDGTTGKLVQDSANATMADNGALTLATGAVTDPQPILDLSQTWNDANDTFTAIKANVTNTASASGSLLMDLQVGGISKVNADKNGTVFFSNANIDDNGYLYGNIGGVIKLSYAGNGFVIKSNQIDTDLVKVHYKNGSGLILHGAYGLLFSSSSPNEYDVTVGLYRDANDTLAQRRSTNAQESRLYGSYTSATAYQRLSTKTIREAVTCAAGASVTTTISIPKYTHLIGVTTRVTTALGTTNSTTGYTVGDGTDADLWGAITGTAQGTTSDRRDFTAVDALGPDGADRTITLTAVGGNFDGTGVIEVCAYYLAAEAD